MENRIYNENVPIDDVQTKTFFMNRIKKNVKHRYNYVSYQDAHPELALQRDQEEKKKIGKLLSLNSSSNVLDIGCGVGRWADEVGQYFLEDSAQGMYVGIDYNMAFLNVAKQVKRPKNCQFYNGSFQELKQSLQQNGVYHLYDVILINGVLVYINDADIVGCLKSVDDICGKGGKIYIKEPVGIDSRLTLRNFYSEELQSDYNAIYRSLREYTFLIAKYFLSRENGYKLLCCGPIWDNELENRKETMHFYWILEK